MQNISTLVSCADLLAGLDDREVRVIDCRFVLSDPELGRAQYHEAHIPGAVYAHLDADLSGRLRKGAGRHPLPDPERFKHTLDAWGIRNSDKIVVYDQGSGGIAARAWWLLRWVGHDQVAVLDGGWQVWADAGNPVATDGPEVPKSNFTINLHNHLYITDEEILRWHTKGDHVLVDSRTPERYTGEQEPIDPVAGHIPGAINIPFPGNIDENGKWKHPAQLAHRFARLEEPSRTVFYCGSGVTACQNILAYKHAGLGDALLYAGSWSGWIADPSHPVAIGIGNITNPKG